MRHRIAPAPRQHARLAAASPWLAAPLAVMTSLLVMAAAIPGTASATDVDASNPVTRGAGLVASPLNEAAALGMPLYPGARPLRDPGDEGAGANVALWGGPFGMQLRVIKLLSGDAPASVAAFYRQALAAEGTVLDCSAPRPPAPADAPARSSTREGGRSAEPRVLRCDNDKPPAGGYLFKAGTPKRMRVVAIEPKAGGTQVQLVRLDIRAD